MLTKRTLTPTADVTAAERIPIRGADSTWLIHVGAALWIGALLSLARFAPLEYNALVQEDRFIEWWTVTLFAAAAVIRVRAAWPERRIFDLLVAAFCVFVAGEEFSWGQRLLGFTAPASFLEHNTQQELTLHNFADVFGRPKFTLMAVLFGYGVLLPLVARSASGKRWLERAGASTPAPSTIVWFVVAMILLLIYPIDFTGEWVEVLVGALFFLAARPARRTLAWAGLATVALALGLSAFSARSVASDSASLACAHAETDALVRDIARGGAATSELTDHGGSVHKRVYTAVQDGYIDAAALHGFQNVQCGKSKEYLLDPWGMAYWLRVSRDQGEGRTITVYSMGPDRKRDDPGDDVIARLDHWHF